MKKNVHGNVDPTNEKKYKVLHEEDRKTIENRINDLYEKGWVLVGNVRFEREDTRSKFTATMKNTKV